MMKNVLRIFIPLLLGNSLTFGSLYEFIQLPNIVQLLALTQEQTLTSADVYGCTAIITPTTIGLAYTTANVCITYSKLVGFNTRVTGITYYLRMPGKCGACASLTEAKSAIINYVYGMTACPDTIFTYDEPTGYCVGNISDQVVTNANPYFTNYASYTQGVYRNGTMLAMSRGMAVQALEYLCPFANSTQSTFNGVWYCYTPFTTSTPAVNYILNNICGTWINGGTVIKFIHPAEPGYLSIRIGANAYTGMYYPGSSPYLYYDNTAIPVTYRVWASGMPNNKKLVFLDNNLLLNSYDATKMARLMCRNVATPA